MLTLILFPRELDPSDDEHESFSWLEEMGVQDKVKKPDTISIKLYPFLAHHDAGKPCRCYLFVV